MAEILLKYFTLTVLDSGEIDAPVNEYFTAQEPAIRMMDNPKKNLYIKWLFIVVDFKIIPGHGLDTIYPSEHKNSAKEIMANGAILSDFPSKTKADRQNFIKRNRIIAGLSDITVVVESGVKGGALITADIANSYSRDVAAVPGRVGDRFSEGCNELIRLNKAALVTSALDITQLMGWEVETDVIKHPVQHTLFAELSKEEHRLVELLAMMVQNELVAAYNELRDDFAKAKFGKKFDSLTQEEQDIVKDVYPQRISEAEPKNIK